MAAYTCAECGYTTAYGNPASVALHVAVSHDTGAPIVEQRAE